MDNKQIKSNLQLLKSFPAWQVLSDDLIKQANTLHDELTALDYKRNNDKRFTLDDVKRAELAILEMLIELPDTLLGDLEDSVIIVEDK